MPAPCTVCVHPDRITKIDKALLAGASAGQIAKKYPLLVRRSIERHRANHLVKRDPPAAAAPIGVKAIRTPDDVLAELEWVVASAKAMHADAEAVGDWRMADRAMQTATAAIDKLARSANLYSDATVVNVNSDERKVVSIFASLSTEQLRALKALDDKQILALVSGLEPADG